MPIDALVTIKIALYCELSGIPVIEHLYIDTDGHAVCMRARGILKKVPELLLTLRECASGFAVNAWKEGRCEDDSPEKRKASREPKKARVADDPVIYQSRRGPQKG